MREKLQGRVGEEREWILTTEEDWDQVVEDLWPLLQRDVWLSLVGDLGVGKTSFVRRVLRHFGVEGSIGSPTYPLILDYEFGSRSLFHLDAFRVDPRHESPFVPEALEGALVFVEWAERSGLDFERFHAELRIERLDETSELRKVLWKCFRPFN